MFSYLPVAYLVQLEGMEIYLGKSQRTEGKYVLERNYIARLLCYERKGLD